MRNPKLLHINSKLELRFWYSDLKRILLKAYPDTVLGFSGNHMLNSFIKYTIIILAYISVWIVVLAVLNLRTKNLNQ